MFDPWLVGSEVDGFRWFNEAWHVDPVIPPEEAGTYNGVLVSQPFSDHNHAATLAALPGAPRVASVPGCGLAGDVIPPLDAEPLQIGDLRIWRLTRPWYHPPRYHALVIADPHDRAVVHAPHGLPPTPAHAVAERFDVVLVAVSRARYQLPFFMGGAVNPGHEAAVQTVRALGAKAALAIHDEPKRASGVVQHLASTDRGPFPEDGIHWWELPIRAPGADIAETR